MNQSGLETARAAAHTYLGNPAPESPRLLLVSDAAWWISAFSAVLQPVGYEVVRATPARTASSGFAPEVDAILIHNRPSAHPALDLCRALRANPLVGDCTPILAVFEDPIPRPISLQMIASGAWECITPPIDAELVFAKLERFIAAKRCTDLGRIHSLLDQSTGLYSAHGIMRRARELGDVAHRHRRALGCVALALADATPLDGEESEETGVHPDRTLNGLIRLLTSHGRTSDVVGRLSHAEFVVLTPETDADGVEVLANRLIRLAREPAPPVAGLAVCAGCYGVTDFSAARIEPIEVVMRAATALRRACAAPAQSPVQVFADTYGN